MVSDSANQRYPFRHVHLTETDSTNSEAMRRALAGDSGPLWITADHQKAGRGRSGRKWFQPAGNLAATYLTSIENTPATAVQLSLVAGVALIDALRNAAGQALPGMVLKWPNDVMIRGAKLAGILVESTAAAGRLSVAIGFGINVAHAPDVEGRGVANLADILRRDVDLADLLSALDRSVRIWLDVWSAGAGTNEIHAAWLERAMQPGELLTVQTTRDVISGRFCGIEDDGALVLVDESGLRRRFTYGDVTLASERETS